MPASPPPPVRVRMPWGDIRAGLDLLEAEANGSFTTVIVGNRVCLDCLDDRDADKLVETFEHARKVKPTA